MADSLEEILADIEQERRTANLANAQEAADIISATVQQYLAGAREGRIYGGPDVRLPTGAAADPGAWASNVTTDGKDYIAEVSIDLPGAPPSGTNQFGATTSLAPESFGAAILADVEPRLQMLSEKDIG